MSWLWKKRNRGDHAATNTGQPTTPLPAGAQGEHVEGSTSSSAFQSLIERSIAAWDLLNRFGVDDTTFDVHANSLKGHSSLESVMKGSTAYWFFQRRESFMNQPVLMKWDPNRLDEYVLIPVAKGFVNKQDCFFVSHYWRTPHHPDPDAVDLALLRQDLETLEWSYIWVDWTCMPQVPRSGVQKTFFKRGLAQIPMLLRDCGFSFRFPTFEPRAWILYEIAAWVLDHKDFTWTDDNRPFIHHAFEMLTSGVRPVIDKYGYKCTNESDLDIVTGWLEIHVLLCQIFEDDVHSRRELHDEINRKEAGSFSCYLDWGIITVDKVDGIISYLGRTVRFTPLFHHYYPNAPIRTHGPAPPTSILALHGPYAIGSYSVDLNGTDFRVVETISEFVGGLTSLDRVALLLPTKKYKTDIHDNIMQQIDSQYGPLSLEQQAFQNACLICACCFLGFPDSDLNSEASNLCPSTHIIAGTRGLTEFSGENGGCARCGSQESFLIYERYNPSEVRQRYEDAVRRCWRDRAKRWWFARGGWSVKCGGSAICDHCCKDIDEKDETYLISRSRLECRRCTDSLLSHGAPGPVAIIGVSTLRFNTRLF